MELFEMKKNRQQLAEHVGKLISNERQATHGDPNEQFTRQVELMAVLEAGPSWEALSHAHKHALQMITTKLSRVVSGCSIQDSWLDVAGYSLIAAETAEHPLEDPETAWVLLGDCLPNLYEVVEIKGAGSNATWHAHRALLAADSAVDWSEAWPWCFLDKKAKCSVALTHWRPV
jgi:hypothetical protein